MESNERFDQLESLMADMLRRMDQLAASINQLTASQERIISSQEHTSGVLDSLVEVVKITDQRFEKVEETLLRHDERFRRSEERQDATLRLLMQQSENLTASFRALESHESRIQKLEDNKAA